MTNREQIRAYLEQHEAQILRPKDQQRQYGRRGPKAPSYMPDGSYDVDIGRTHKHDAGLDLIDFLASIFVGLELAVLIQMVYDCSII